ncbi:MAG: helix-turn-helix domain-containing protein [Akkermansiaceae bacterium]|nr:helix-turn-helix domain-containing protein [Akkermansiaceae bacterium]
MDYITEFKREGFDRQKLFRLPTRAEARMLSLSFTKDMVVSDVGYYPRAEGHLVERKKGLKSHILVFCLSGQGWFSRRGKRREVVPMDVFWIPAREAHAYGAHRSDPWEIYWVHAYGSLVEDLLAWTSLSDTRPTASFSNTNALRRQFNALIQRLELGYTDHTLLELSRFFVSLTNLLHVEAGSEREIQQKDVIEKAMDTMRQTVSAPLSLHAYAREAGLSVSRFSHLFKRHYGTSPMAYFTELRMQRAKALLDDTHLSIKEVSWQLGFDDQLYFSRSFKKVTGISPSAYRLEHA